MARKSPDEVRLERRKIIKMLLMERGMTNREEIRRCLHDEFGFELYNRGTIVNDIKQLAKLKEVDVEEFELDILSEYKRMIRNQRVEIEACTDARERTMMRKALSQLIKDMHSVANQIALRGKPGESSKEFEKEEKSKRVVFG